MLFLHVLFAVLFEDTRFTNAQKKFRWD